MKNINKTSKMIHLERSTILSQGGDESQYSYKVHLIDSEDKLTQLIALEQQLELTEQRFRRLQDYVNYIRNLYHGSAEDSTSVQICNMTTSINMSALKEVEDTNGGGDSVYVGDMGKEDMKKKKEVKKRGSVRKLKIPSRRTQQDDHSYRLIEKKAKMKMPPVRRTEITTFTSSYLRPTVSSKMKAIRPCHPGFNFRSIPFVAGQATTRSHNLGIKIQETLSIIKRNTPTDVGRCAERPNSEQQPPTSPPYQEGPQCFASRSRCSLDSKIGTMKSKSTVSDGYLQEELMDDNEDNNEDNNNYLKKALLYIQSDFTETLNIYKSLIKKKDPENDDMVEQLEEKLDRKEEVIIAFSKLYNQVCTLKRQLRDAEQSRLESQNPALRSAKVFYSYPAIKLTRLLRKIQDFQNRMQGFPVL